MANEPSDTVEVESSGKSMCGGKSSDLGNRLGLNLGCLSPRADGQVIRAWNRQLSVNYKYTC